MKKIIFYSYPKSSTRRKTLNWPDLNDIYYLLTKIVKEPTLKILAKLVLEKFSLDLNIFDLTKKKIIELFSNYGRPIKRPSLIIKEINLILVFNDS